MRNPEQMPSNLTATYLAAYNQLLEQAFAIEANVKAIISQLNLILFSHNSATYIYTIGDECKLPEATVNQLQLIYQYYTSDDVEPKYIGHFQIIIRDRLTTFINQLEAMPPQELANFCQEQQQLHINKQTQIEQNRLQQQHLQAITHNQYDSKINQALAHEMRKFGIDHRTKYPDAIICKRICSLLAISTPIIDDLNERELHGLSTQLSHANHMKSTAVMDAYNELTQDIFVLPAEKASNANDLEHAHNTMRALFRIFNASLISHDTVKDLAISHRITILWQAEFFASLVENDTTGLVFELFLPMIALIAELKPLDNVNSGNLHDNIQLLSLMFRAERLFYQHKLMRLETSQLDLLDFKFILTNTLAILQHPNINFNEFIRLDATVKDYVLATRSPMLELIKFYGLRVQHLQKCNYKTLELLDKHYENFGILTTHARLTLDLIFNRSADIAEEILFRTKAICQLAYGNAVYLDQLITSDISDAHLNCILHNLEKLPVLINFYFIKIEELANMELRDLNNVFYNHNRAYQFVASRSKDLPFASYIHILNQHLARADDILKLLAAHGTALQIDKLAEIPTEVTRALIAAGLSFFKARELYTCLININNRFATRFFSQLLATQDIYPCDFDHLFANLSLTFTRDEKRQLRTSLMQYTKQLSIYLNTKYKIPEQWYRITRNALQFSHSDLSDAEILQLSQYILQDIRVALNLTSRSHLTAKQVLLYKSILNSKLCTYFANDGQNWKDVAKLWKKHLHKGVNSEQFTNLLQGDARSGLSEQAYTLREIYTKLYTIKHVINSYLTAPSNYCSALDTQHEDEIFQAIANRDKINVSRILLISHNIESNRKGLSVLVAAIITRDPQIFSKVKSAIRGSYGYSLHDFLQRHGFRDITAYNADGETTLTQALKLKQIGIIQLLLTEAISIDKHKLVINKDFLRANQRYESPQQIALSLALYSPLIDLLELTRILHTFQSKKQNKARLSATNCSKLLVRRQ